MSNVIKESKLTGQPNLMESKEIEIMLKKQKSSLCKIKTSKGVDLGVLSKFHLLF